VRVGARCAELFAKRTPPLLGLAVRGSIGPGADKAQATFRDELLALARESTEVSWRELRRGVDELDGFTRPVQDPLHTPPRRPYRVKW
jgi:hypothetical protein